MIATSKGTKEKFLKAQRIDITVEVIYDRIKSHEAQDEASKDQPQPPSSPLESAEASNGDEVTNHTMDLAVSQWKSVGMDLGSANENLNLDSYLTADFQQISISTEWSLIEALSDEGFLQIADHIRLHKKVTGFALDTISQPEKNEDQNSESEQTIGASDGVQETEEELSEQSYQPARAGDTDDDEGQETKSMSSAQSTATQGQRPSNNAQDAENRPRGYDSDAQEQPRGSRSHSHETRRLGSDSWQENGNPSPSAFEYFNEGASSSRRSDRYPDRVHGFAPPRGSGQEDIFYRNEPSAMGNFFLPAHLQTAYSSSGGRIPSPMERPDPEMEAMKAQLALYQEERKRQEEQKEREQRDNAIREDAERAFKIRMEEMYRAQEEAKKEIELAKIAAENAVLERVEEERKAEKERERLHAEALSKAHREARESLEREALERKQRQGLRGLFNRSSKS